MQAHRIPRWARWLLIAAATLVAILVVLYVLGAPGTAGAATPKGAASATCPNYVLIQNWNGTGGSGVFDTCADGAAAGYGDLTTASAATASAGQTCRTVNRKITVKNRLGIAMFWFQLTKHWCWARNTITYKPSTTTSSGLTTFGSGIQWKNHGVQSKGTYNDSTFSSHSFATWEFVQQPCAPIIGCFSLREAHPGADIWAFGDGSYHF